MIFDELISAIADMFDAFAPAVERAVEVLAEYRKMPSDDFFFEGYTPMEYAQRKCKREIIQEIFRPCERRYFIFPCLCGVPGIIRKKGRFVKRGAAPHKPNL